MYIFKAGVVGAGFMGGEIAQGRPDSELVVYLRAVHAQLQLADTDPVLIHNWDGVGIIDSIQIESEDVE